MTRIDESALRRIIREELERHDTERLSTPTLLTIRECAKRFRRGYDTIKAMAKKGELAVRIREDGKNGLPQTFIVLSDAESKLGMRVPT